MRGLNNAEQASVALLNPGGMLGHHCKNGIIPAIRSGASDKPRFDHCSLSKWVRMEYVEL